MRKNKSAVSRSSRFRLHQERGLVVATLPPSISSGECFTYTGIG